MTLVSPLLFLLLATAPLHSVPQWHAVTHSDGRLIVESPQHNLSRQLLDWASDAQQKLAAQFRLTAGDNSQLLLRVEREAPDRPPLAPRLQAWVTASQLVIQIDSSVNTPRSELRRSLVQALLYRALYARHLPHPQAEHLPFFPLWLLEGIAQSLSGESQPEHAAIIRRAARLGAMPSVDQVATWRELSADSLERRWQQAFTFHLVQFALLDARRMTELQNWLQEMALLPLPRSPLPWVATQELQEAWVRSAGDSRILRPPLFYTWQQTAQLLREAQAIVLPATETAPEVNTQLAQLHEHRSHPSLVPAVQRKLDELTVLEMRSPFTWRRVIQRTRECLHLIAYPPPDRQRPFDYAGAMLLLAQFTEETAQQCQQLVDYLNWAEVTLAPSAEEESIFRAALLLDREHQQFLRSMRRAEPAANSLFIQLQRNPPAR